MPIDIANPLASTWVFVIVLVASLLVSLKRKEGSELLPPSLSQELKGFAMLAIIFAHIGYFLVSDHRFLFPLSILAGVGVDLFLFLSGFGLAISALKKQLSPIDFYKRHAPKLYVPLWIVLVPLFAIDFYFLGKSYSWQYIGQSLLGIFPSADLFSDINSPLWYFTFILFLYVIFPLLFVRQRPLLSALLVYLAVKGVFLLHLPFLYDVEHLYELHILAFPIGIGVAGLYARYAKERKILEGRLEAMGVWLRAGIILPLLGVFSYFAYFSGIGTPAQEYISLTLVLLALTLFILNRSRFSLLYLSGILSYELYLIHWPLMSRYDVLYQNLPAWLATILYIPLLLGLAWGLHKFATVFLKKG